MQKVFDEVNSLDQRCYHKFGLSEDILMEHAAASLARVIYKKFDKNKTILIACGMGNNGADGIALARLLYTRFNVKLYVPFELKSHMAKLQFKRVQKLGIKTVKKVMNCDIVVDCLFGSGLGRKLDEQSIKILQQLNKLKAYKIACDIPSGIYHDGQIASVVFYAHETITMGALKTSLFSDMAKEYVGKISVANLGIQRKVYEKKSHTYCLESSDLVLPIRTQKNSHKGTFGHLNVVVGCKKGAGIIAAKAAFAFGAGLVSVISHEDLDLPYHIMQTHKITQNCSAIVIGMGLGNYEKNEIKKILAHKLPMIIDADLFYEELILDVLNQEVVLTPHPKEFCSLLNQCQIANISVEELQCNRFVYVKKFTQKYPKVVLLLKGANVLIAQNKSVYINALGNAVLAKGGSGDVLSGLVASLLAQGYTALNAAVSASLAHTIAANNYAKNNYSLIPSDLVEEVKKL
jgi:hydroxyethylthiazole kinase-like uncharacterized protein yjeF